MSNPRHHRTIAIALALLAATVAAAGCIGADDGGGADPDVQRAQVTQDTGGVEGVVIDNAVQPVAGANVTAMEDGATATTDDSGAFALSNLAPGQVTLVVSAPGFHSQQETITVRAGEVAKVEFTLTRVSVQQPFIDKLEFAGYQECATEAGWNLSQTGEFFLGVSWCSFPNAIGSGNVTNDRFSFIFATRPDMQAMVFEAEWQPTQPNAGPISWNLEARGYSNVNNLTFAEPKGESPIHSVVTEERIRQIDRNLVTRCEEGDDDACGRSYINNGDEVQIRAFPYWTCVSETAGMCSHIQQPFTAFVSVFYHQEVPQGYTVRGGF